MAHNIGVYCEPDIYFDTDLKLTLDNLDSFWGRTTFTGKAGHYFFGDYSIYFENSIFYQVCKYLKVDLYLLFYPLNHIPDWSTISKYMSEYKWHNIQSVKQNINNFISGLKMADEVELMMLTESCNSSYSVINFSKYYNSHLIPDLQQAIGFIDIFDTYGAQKVVFGYH